MHQHIKATASVATKLILRQESYGLAKEREHLQKDKLSVFAYTFCPFIKYIFTGINY